MKIMHACWVHSGKLWRALIWQTSEFKFGNCKHFCIASVLVHEIILAGFKFGDFPQNRQFDIFCGLLKLAPH